MIKIAQFHSDIPSHELPHVDAHLCVPSPGNAKDAYIEEKTAWAGEFRTPFPIERVDVDNRGEPYRIFAVAISEGRLFPMSLYDAVDLIGIPVFSPELMDLLLHKGFLA
ncbi:MAG: hypothetical protein VKL39_24070, partial [Leptolyngbyaceae bacterium]|nr:hypothetical protein [Leptolyngbyaceae bacterium]